MVYSLSSFLAAGRKARGLALACVAFSALAALPAAQAQSAAALQAHYEHAKGALAHSAFQRPVLLDSRNSASRPAGEVYAVVEHPFRLVGKALQRSEVWCDIMTLPANVKHCSVTGRPGDMRLTLAVGRKVEQALADTYPLAFKYGVLAADEDYLSVQMSADEGPMGTRAYRLTLEAVPIDARRSFLHLSYSYANGFAARLATDAYLATAGRDKVGFTVTGQDADGHPAYIDGIRGVAERNTMRYFLAIEAYLGAQAAPEPQRAEKRLHDWFAATERYPRQLREMSMQDYLVMKRRELQLPSATGPQEG